MPPLTSFTQREKEVVLRLRPTKGPPDESANEVKLPAEGAFGVVDTTYTSAARVGPLLRFDEDAENRVVFEPLRLLENVDYEFSLVTPYSQTEFNRRQQASENPVWPFANEKLSKALIFNGSDSCREVNGLYRITGRVKFDNQLGAVDLSLDEEVSPLKLRAEVTTNKIDYERDFHILLEHLGEINRELVLNLDAPTEVSLGLQHNSQRSPHSTILQLRRVLHPDALPHAVATILGNPIYQYKPICEVEATAFVTAPDWLALHSRPAIATWISGGPLAKTFCGVTPTSLPSHRVEKSFDTPENRFVKYALQQLLELVRDVTRKLSKEYRASRKGAREWEVVLEEMLLRPFWRQIGDCVAQPYSMAFYERSGYRDFIQVIHELELALAFDPLFDFIDPTSGDLKPIWELYEFWCYIQLHDILRSLSGSAGDPPLQSLIAERRLTTTLRSGDAGRTRFKWEHSVGGEIEVELHYTKWTLPKHHPDKLWEGSYSTKFRPDYSLVIKSHGQSHWVHFDAKYRVSASSSAGASRTYRTEDIDTMHMYRDAILGTRGSYVLFPGDSVEPTLFIRHASNDYRTSFPGPSVGAFPLCPSADGVTRSQLASLSFHLQSIIDAAASHPNYREEEGWSDVHER